MTIAQAELEIDCLPQLLKKKLIKAEGEFIKIQFLDEQMDCIDETSVKRSNAAKERWKEKHSNVMQVHTIALQNSNGAMQIDAERKKEKIREDRESYYPTSQKAFEDISNNYKETEPHRNILTNRGWRAADKKDTDALLFHFLESQANLDTQTISDIKSHFKKWLNKYPLTELQTLSTKINERLASKIS
jgi:hypothetical protein